MCDPVTLFGTVGGAAIAGTPLATLGTAGLIGSGGAFSLATGSLTSGLYSSVANMGIGSIFQLGGFGLQYFGARYQGQVAESQAQYQANVARYNAQVAENDAILAMQSAEMEADKVDDLRKRVSAQANVGFATANVVINQDIPLMIQTRIARDAAEDRFNVLFKGQTAATAARSRGAGQMAAARNFERSGATAITASKLKSTAAALKAGESLLV